MEPLTGRLVVAPHDLTDTSFRRTVVLIIEHRASGTLGVVLNRPSDVPVRDVLPSWGPHTTVPQSLSTRSTLKPSRFSTSAVSWPSGPITPSRSRSSSPSTMRRSTGSSTT